MKNPDFVAKYWPSLVKVAKQNNTTVEKLLKTAQPNQPPVDDAVKKNSTTAPKDRKQHGNLQSNTLDHYFNVEKLGELPNDHIMSLFRLKMPGPGSIDPLKYARLRLNALKSPQFILPLKKPSHIELMFTQYVNSSANQCFLATSLAEYKLRQENSVPSFKLTFFNEFLTKNLVLTSMWHDNSLTQDEARLLSSLIILVYTSKSPDCKYELLTQFTSGDANFSIDKLLTCLDTL